MKSLGQSQEHFFNIVKLNIKNLLMRILAAGYMKSLRLFQAYFLEHCEILCKKFTAAYCGGR